MIYALMTVVLGPWFDRAGGLRNDCEEIG